MGSAKVAQSRIEEPEERLSQVMRKRNCRPGHRKSMLKVQEVKKWIFEKINQIDKTGKADQVKRGWGEH